VPDAKAAAKFYEGVFGWRMQHNEEYDYTMWSDGAGSGGGFVSLQDESANGKVLVYIASDDIDADLKQVVASGGKVIKPKIQISETGWFAVFEDPTGNRLALFTSMNS